MDRVIGKYFLYNVELFNSPMILISFVNVIRSTQDNSESGFMIDNIVISIQNNTLTTEVNISELNTEFLSSVLKQIRKKFRHLN